MNPERFRSQLNASRSIAREFRGKIRAADSLAERSKIVVEKAAKHYQPIASVQDVCDALKDAGLFNDPEFKRQLQGLSSLCNK